MKAIAGFLRRFDRIFVFFLVATISLALHWRVFPMDLMSIHVWRQTETQTTIVNFCEEDFNILNPKKNDRGNSNGIFRMEFPIMQWTFAGFLKLFGNHIAISRILTFLISLMTVWGMYQVGWNLFQQRLPAMISMGALTFSPSFFYYSVNPMPDNFSLCCGVWGISLFLGFVRQGKIVWLLLSAFMLGLATLAKLPFVLFYVFPLAWGISQFLRNRGFVFQLLAFPILLSPAAMWYISVIPGWQSATPVVAGIFGGENNRDSMLEILYGNLTSVVPESILNYAAIPMFLAGIWFVFRNNLHRNEWFPVFLSWFLAMTLFFVYELDLIGTVHDYYLFPFLPFLFLAVGYGGSKLLESKQQWVRGFVLLCLAALPATCYIRMTPRWNPDKPGFNKDLLLYKEDLRNAVPDTALCIIGCDESHYIWHYYLNKRGWTFSHRKLDAETMKDYISKGARYLYSDAREVDENQEMKELLGKMLAEKGSVRVYELRESGNRWKK